MSNDVAGEDQDVALKFQVVAVCGRARHSRVTLKHGVLQTPAYMAVGTHGTVKGITPESLEAIGYEMILGNTYHLANRPGEEILQQANPAGLHGLMKWNRNLLTDSGGFQMVSLLKLSKMTEEGVQFMNPFDSSTLLLTPEKSMETQNVIGADVMMALDDVVSAVHPEKSRVDEATDRTTRWLDRCIAAHKRPKEQSLFGIVQGGLHEDLRLRSIKDLCKRNLPGYAIGGLSGGESKDDFWKIVDLCCRKDSGLPENKPRYLMGVGYPLDLVVCVALGVDMFDCVYPTRTARFGTALVPEGTMRLKSKRFANDFQPIQKDCPCEACTRYTRAFFNTVAAKEPTAARLITLHNLTFMFRLGAAMRDAISANCFDGFVKQFLKEQFRSGLKNQCNTNSKEQFFEAAPTPPLWVKHALKAAAIDIEDMYDWARAEITAVCGAPHDEKSSIKKSKRERGVEPETNIKKLKV